MPILGATVRTGMTAEQPERKRRRRGAGGVCHCCKNSVPYCRSCLCGFAICPACFAENAWGMSNGPTWICPDCERVHLLE